MARKNDTSFQYFPIFTRLYGVEAGVLFCFLCSTMATEEDVEPSDEWLAKETGLRFDQLDIARMNLSECSSLRMRHRDGVISYRVFLERKEPIVIPGRALSITDPSSLAVYVRFRANMEEETGFLRGSVSGFAREMAISLGTLRRALKILRKAGHIDLVGPSGQQRWVMVGVGSERAQ